jgi:hypothetical protein
METPELREGMMEGGGITDSTDDPEAEEARGGDLITGMVLNMLG